MQIAITGATGFLGRYLVQRLAGHNRCRCWYRATSDRGGLEDLPVEWVEGELGQPESFPAFVSGCEAVVHAALDFPGGLAQRPRVHARLRAAKHQGHARTDGNRPAIGRGPLHLHFQLRGLCAYSRRPPARRIASDVACEPLRRPQGSHRSFRPQLRVERGVFDLRLRPSGIYGVAHPVENSKWYNLVQQVVRGETVQAERGGKEVHAADVAAAVDMLLTARHVIGNAYNCADRYISEFDVATLAKQLSGSNAKIEGGQTRPKHQIVCDKLRSLGFEFGGQKRLEETIAALVEHARRGQPVRA